MKTMTTEFWTDLYPDQRWPGPLQAFAEMAMEIHALRMLTDELVGMAVEGEGKLRSMDEIQRAHDILACLVTQPKLVERLGPDTLRIFVINLDVLCWALHHDHNETFQKTLDVIQEHLAMLGIRFFRHPEMQDPTRRET